MPGGDEPEQAYITDRAGGYTKDPSENYDMNNYPLHYGKTHGRYREKFNNNRSSLIKMHYIKD